MAEDYGKVVDEIRELQIKIKAHQTGGHVLTNYAECLKRLKFLRDRLRILKSKKGL